jgi:hypothetical protein
MATWIADTDHGRYRVKTVSTVDQGEWLSLESWAEHANRWVLVPFAEQLRSVSELERHIDLNELREEEV